MEGLFALEVSEALVTVEEGYTESAVCVYVYDCSEENRFYEAVINMIITLYFLIYHIVILF